jgi:hypothetical protein
LRQVSPALPLRINFVKDFGSDSINRFITPGGSVKIGGHNLKIAGTDELDRIEFVSLKNPATIYPVPPTGIIVNNTSELLITVPPMPANENVHLKITTQYSSKSNKLLKKPRSVIFEKTLTAL